MTETLNYDVTRVMAVLPHRYPMLLVDRVEELVKNESIRAIKAVTMNEGFFQGHFPGRPIMPGVMIVEALAQAAGVLAMESFDMVGSGKLVYFMAIDGAKFRQPVEPGCLLSLNVKFEQKRARVCKFSKESCPFAIRRLMRRFRQIYSLRVWSVTSPYRSRK